MVQLRAKVKSFSLCYFALFHVRAGLQGRLLSHSYHTEQLVPQLSVPGASQCQGNVGYSLACAEVFFLYLRFKLAAGFVGNVRNISLSYNLSRLIKRISSLPCDLWDLFN